MRRVVRGFRPTIANGTLIPKRHSSKRLSDKRGGSISQGNVRDDVGFYPPRRYGGLGTVRICAEGLNALAGHSAAMATQLADRVPTPIASPPTQATSAAVSSAYVALAAVATVLATRAQTTAGKLTTSASQYVSTDETSAQRLSGLGGGPGRE